MLRSSLLVAALLLAPVVSLEAQAAAPTVVVIVRHADKAAEPANDPPLTAIGTERAAALADFLKDAKVAAVLHTATTRTRETVRPIAERAGVTPEIIPAGPPAAVAAAIRAAAAKHPGKTVVVAGHSNTVMPWIAALGGPTRANLCDHEYNGIYTLVLGGPEPVLVEARYGPPNPAPTAPCETMQTRP